MHKIYTSDIKRRKKKRKLPLPSVGLEQPTIHAAVQCYIHSAIEMCLQPTPYTEDMFSHIDTCSIPAGLNTRLRTETFSIPKENNSTEQHQIVSRYFHNIIRI